MNTAGLQPPNTESPAIRQSMPLNAVQDNDYYRALNGQNGKTLAIVGGVVLIGATVLSGYAIHKGVLPRIDCGFMSLTFSRAA